MLKVGVAENRVSVSATSISPAETAVYSIEASFDTPVSPTSHFEILFPPGYNTAAVSIVSSTTLDGTFTAEVENGVVIVRRQGASTVLDAGKPFDLKIAVIINPVQPLSTAGIILVLKQDEREIGRAESSAAIQLIESIN